MDECSHYQHLLNKVDRSKDDFLDWFEHLFEIDGKHEDLYEIIIGWSNEKSVAFAKWFDWNIDKIRFRIWRFDREHPRYIVIEQETEKTLSSRDRVFRRESFNPI